MAVVALIGYALAISGRNQLHNLAKRAYYLFTLAIVLASAYFLLQILSHNFTVSYVFEYSSTDLPLGFLVSTFWAGQVGSFLLWLLFIAIIGLFLVHRKSENDIAVMFFYMLVVAFFLTLMVARSPFLLIPEHFLTQFPGGIPPDGRGLNPLLQNFWMVIHPPIVFLGFALLTVPFCYALAALTRNNYQDWVRNASPWAMISLLFLGAGIFLGAYWSYETLGWGGYWAWDPVENASLIPWLLNLALIHGFLVEHRKGVLRRSNLALALFSFLLVIYGTFLTRSGVLADFSVHSFTDLGTSGYLVFFMLLFVVLSLILLIVRLRSAATGRSVENLLSTDFALAIGVFFLVLLALLTLAGTSAPLITRIFSEPANVSRHFYNTIALPIAIVIAFLVGLSPFLMTKEKSLSSLTKHIAIPVILSIISLVFARLAGVNQLQYLIMVFFAAFAVFGNIFFLFRQPRGIGSRLGSSLTHIGVGVMLVGIIVSAALSQSEKVNLFSGYEPLTTLGYQISYKGLEGDINNRDNALILEIDDGSNRFMADPKYFIASENEGLMRKPFIKKYLSHDLYLSPQNQQTVGDGDKLILYKGQQLGIGDLGVRFVDFDLGSHDDGGAMKVGAVLAISRDTLTEIVTPYLNFDGSGKRSLKADLPFGEGTVILRDIQADAGMVSLQFSGVSGIDIIDLLVLEISTKPLINFIWLGLIMICVGTIISYFHRRRLQRPIN